MRGYKQANQFEAVQLQNQGFPGGVCVERENTLCKYTNGLNTELACLYLSAVHKLIVSLLRWGWWLFSVCLISSVGYTKTAVL